VVPDRRTDGAATAVPSARRPASRAELSDMALRSFRLAKQRDRVPSMTVPLDARRRNALSATHGGGRHGGPPPAPDGAAGRARGSRRVLASRASTSGATRPVGRVAGPRWRRRTRSEVWSTAPSSPTSPSTTSSTRSHDARGPPSASRGGQGHERGRDRAREGAGQARDPADRRAPGDRGVIAARGRALRSRRAHRRPHVQQAERHRLRPAGAA
jgi:hypothetical protein